MGITVESLRNLTKKRTNDYLCYGDEIKSALFELLEYRSAGLTPEEITQLNTFVGSQVEKLLAENDALQAEAERVRAERDAAIAELKKERGCNSCKMVDNCVPAFYLDNCHEWQWRGLREVSGEDDK